MRQWFVLFNKEWLEILRSYRILWLPISFIVLGATQPIATFFMPDILASAGNMPEGAIIQILTPMPYEVMASALSQFGVIGLLLIALSGMGAISGEKASGTAAMVLVKPVSYVSFVTAKWAALLLLAAMSFIAGYGAAWYYTSTLFDSIGWGEVAKSALLFALWLGFVGTLALLFSALLRSAAAAAFGALATAAVLSIASSALPYEQSWNPGRLSGLAAESLNAGAGSPGGGQGAVWLTVIVTAAAMLAALAAASGSLKRMPSND